MSYKKIHISYNTENTEYPYKMNTDGYTVKPYNKYTFVFPDGTSEDVVLVPCDSVTCNGCLFYTDDDRCSCSTPDICRVEFASYVNIIPMSKMLEVL